MSDVRLRRESGLHLSNARTRQVICFLQTYVPQDQKSLHDHVQRHGGPMVVLQEQRTLEKISALSATTQPGDQGTLSGIQDLEHDLKKNPKEAAEANFLSFGRKLEIIQRQIADETEKIVVRESDRVIESVIAGPHDRLVDKVGTTMDSLRSDVTHLFLGYLCYLERNGA